MSIKLYPSIGLIICMMIASPSFSQNDEYKVVSVQAPITYSLNSAGNLLASSSTSMRVALPEYTVTWYYLASASKTGASKTSLFSQLSKFAGTAAIPATILAELIVPDGDANADFYVMNEANNNLFTTNKEFKYYKEGSTLSTTKAKMEIKNQVSNLYYLGITNKSFAPIKVTVEVVALLRIPEYKYGSFSNEARTDWQGESGLNVVNILKNELDSKIQLDKTILIGTEDAWNDVKECVIDKIINKYTLQAYLAQAKATRDYNLMMDYKACAPNYYYAPSEAENQAVLYGNMGWKAFEQSNYNNCIKYSEQSLAITPLFFVKTNLALCYLVKGLETESITHYTQSLTILKNNKQPITMKLTYINAAIQDLQTEKKKRYLKGADDAIAFLEGVRGEYW